MYRSPTTIDSLPNELLSYIFELSTHDQSELMPGGSRLDSASSKAHPSSVKMPCILSAVNRHWRSVALGTPMLWTTLFVGIHDVHHVVSPQGIVASGQLNLAPMQMFITRSKHCPVNVQINAQDPEWDCNEADVTSEDGGSEYGFDFSDDFPSKPSLFCPGHMSEVFALILPLMPRWRSLTIMADEWRPMHTALEHLSTYSPSSTGAPLLEYLFLERGSDIRSFSPVFLPEALKTPVQLTFGTDPNVASVGSIFPRLQHVCMSGVHVDWDFFARSLPVGQPTVRDKYSDITTANQNTGLQSLSMAFHTLDVSPSFQQFTDILRVSANLRMLSIKGSGPEYDKNCHPIPPVSLPLLDAFHFGYQDAYDAREVLHSFTAANLRLFTLHKYKHPFDASPDELNDAECILRYLSTGVYDADSTSRASGPRFPLLESFTLNRVDTADASTRFRSLFASVPKLKHLELVGVPRFMQAMCTLGPANMVVSELVYPQSTGVSAIGAGEDVPLACPQLQSVVIGGEPDYGCTSYRDECREVFLRSLAAIFQARRVSTEASPPPLITVYSSQSDYDYTHQPEDEDVALYPGGIEITYIPSGEGYEIGHVDDDDGDSSGDGMDVEMEASFASYINVSGMQPEEVVKRS